MFILFCIASLCVKQIKAGFGKFGYAPLSLFISSGYILVMTFKQSTHQRHKRSPLPLFTMSWFLALFWVSPLWAQQLPVVTDNGFIEAARTGNLDALKAAHAAGYSVDSLGRNGQSALHAAAEWGHLAAVQQLLDWGAKPDKRAKTRHTAMNYAVVYGHREIIRALLDAKADPNRAGPNYEVPIITAARLGHEKIVRLLLKAGGDVRETDSTGRTASEWAREMRHPKIFGLLKAAGG
jgi:ankyrin repeat protein